MAVICKLCRGSGKNRTGVKMTVNNDICPRCGGYRTILNNDGNERTITAEDNKYIDGNGRVS